MKKIFTKGFIQKVSLIVCGIVVVAAPLISQDCLVLWYQPEEPEGLKEFAESSIGKNHFERSC